MRAVLMKLVTIPTVPVLDILRMVAPHLARHALDRLPAVQDHIAHLRPGIGHFLRERPHLINPRHARQYTWFTLQK